MLRREEKAPSDNEQLLMSYLTDLQQMEELFAKWSPNEASLYEADLQAIGRYLNWVSIQLTALLISAQETQPGGITSVATSQ